jgi:uncharacterized cofD-like protein
VGVTGAGYFREITNLRLWLTPGMGVKRHVILAVVGTLVLIAGVVAGMLWVLSENRDTVAAPIEAVLVSRAWRQWGGWLALAIIMGGFGLAVASIGRLNRSLLSNWMPEPREAAVVLHRRLSLKNGPHIVALGGGTGLSNLLRGLRNYSSNLTAVVTVSDDGGSSGRLRQAFNMPAPGDLSDCLAALSDYESELSRLLEYRFSRGEALNGHTFGNLFITTLTEVEGDFVKAIRVMNSLLAICGAVYPGSTEGVTLEAIKQDGTRVAGESKLRDVDGAIRSVSIRPGTPGAVPEVLGAIRDADLIVLGPGSLFTSTIPPLLVPETRRALMKTRAPVVYVCNIMTEAGETDGFSAWDHVQSIYDHLGRYPDWVVVNTTPVDNERLVRYRDERAEVVLFAAEPFARAGIRVVGLDLLGGGLHAQHDSARLAQWLVHASKGVKGSWPLEQ